MDLSNCGHYLRSCGGLAQREVRPKKLGPAERSWPVTMILIFHGLNGTRATWLTKTLARLPTSNC